MQPYQERVVVERNELAEKHHALFSFIAATGGVYDSLPKDERGRLVAQIIAMGSYLRILDERIAAFKD